MHRSIRINLLAGYLGALVLLLLAWSVASRSAATLRSDYAYTVRTTDALTNAVLQTTKLRDDEETGLRGYLLTGKRQFLAPYLQARQELPAMSRQLDLLDAAAPDVRPFLQQRRRIANRWEVWAQASLQRAGIYPHGSTALIREQEYGKVLFDQYRAATTQAVLRLNHDRQSAYAAGLDRLSRMNEVFAILFAGAAGLLAFLGWRTTTAVLHPLMALRRAATAIGQGEWTQAVIVRGADEFTRLAGEMDWMRQQLVARESALRASEQRFRAVTESAHDAIVTANRHGHIVSWNAGAATMFGHAAADVIGQPLTLVMPQRLREAHTRAWQRATESGAMRLGGQAVELEGLRADGSEFPLELSLSSWTADDGVYYTGIMRDVTERRRAAEALRESERRLRLLLQTAPVGACIIDEHGIFEDVNQAYAQMHGYAPADLIGQPASIVIAREVRDAVMADFAARLASRTEGQREMQTVTRDGARKTVLVGTAQIVGIDGRSLRASFAVDITARKQAEQRLEQMAHYDALTGLPNRVLFNDRMEQALRLATREQRSGALFVMDLDGFKAVNDRMGHEAGDMVLAVVAGRMRTVLRASDTPARLGGDEFGILLPHTDEHGAITVAAKILAALAEPLDLDGQAARIGGSIGIALFPAHGEDGVALTRAADVAMYWAKREHRGYALYTRGPDRALDDVSHRDVA